MQPVFQKWRDDWSWPKIALNCGSVVLTQNYALIANGATQSQSSDNITLTQNYALVANSATQLQNSGNIALTQHYSILSKDAVQLPSSDNIALSQRYTLTVWDAVQLQTAEKILLVVHQILVNNVTHIQTCENILLNQNYSITANNSSQAQTAEKIVLVVHQILVNNSTQTQSSDNVILTQHHVLVVGDAIQTQNANNISLIYAGNYNITVNNVVQTQSVDNVALTQHHILSINNITQGRIAILNEWWLAGGVNSLNAKGAYQSERAANYSNTKINLANPGTNLTEWGTAPTWDRENGWYFDSTNFFWTGITPPGNNSQYWSIICKATLVNEEATDRFMIGSSDDGGNHFGIMRRGSGDYDSFINGYQGGTGRINAADADAGIRALAGNAAYFNGQHVGTATYNSFNCWRR